MQVGRRERLKRSATEEGFKLVRDQGEFFQRLFPFTVAGPSVESLADRRSVESRDGQQRIVRWSNVAQHGVAGA
jgi:hypothetical protein